MGFDGGSVLVDAVDDLRSVRGLVLWLVFAVVALATLPVHHTVTRLFNDALVEGLGTTPTDIPLPPTPWALDVPVQIATLLLLLVFVIGEALRLIAIRSFDSEDARPIPIDRVFESFGVTFVTLLATSVAVQVLVYGGMVLLFVPGLIMAFLTFFARQGVVLDGLDPLKALKRSGRIVLDHPVSVLILVGGLLLASILVAVPAAVFASLGPSVRTAASAAIGSLTVVYGVAVSTRAYREAMTEYEATEGGEPDVPGPAADVDEG